MEKGSFMFSFDIKSSHRLFFYIQIWEISFYIIMQDLFSLRCTAIYIGEISTVFHEDHVQLPEIPVQVF